MVTQITKCHSKLQRGISRTRGRNCHLQRRVGQPLCGSREDEKQRSPSLVLAGRRGLLVVTLLMLVSLFCLVQIMGHSTSATSCRVKSSGLVLPWQCLLASLPTLPARFITCHLLNVSCAPVTPAGKPQGTLPNHRVLAQLPAWTRVTPFEKETLPSSQPNSPSPKPPAFWKTSLQAFRLPFHRATTSLFSALNSIPAGAFRFSLLCFESSLFPHLLCTCRLILKALSLAGTLRRWQTLGAAASGGQAATRPALASYLLLLSCLAHRRFPKLSWNQWSPQLPVNVQRNSQHSKRCCGNHIWGCPRCLNAVNSAWFSKFLLKAFVPSEDRSYNARSSAPEPTCVPDGLHQNHGNFQAPGAKTVKSESV